MGTRAGELRGCDHILLRPPIGSNRFMMRLENGAIQMDILVAALHYNKHWRLRRLTRSRRRSIAGPLGAARVAIKANVAIMTASLEHTQLRSPFIHLAGNVVGRPANVNDNAGGRATLKMMIRRMPR